MSLPGHEKSLHKALLPQKICGKSALHRLRDIRKSPASRSPNIPAPLSDQYAQKKKEARDSTLSSVLGQPLPPSLFVLQFIFCGAEMLSSHLTTYTYSPQMPVSQNLPQVPASRSSIPAPSRNRVP